MDHHRQPRITLDNPAISDRVRYRQRTAHYTRRHVPPTRRRIYDIVPTKPKPQPVQPTIAPVQMMVHPEPPREQYVEPAQIQYRVDDNITSPEPVTKKPWQPKLFYGLATMLLLAGIVVTYNGWQKGNQANAAVRHLQQASSDNAATNTTNPVTVPSTKPVTSHTKASYEVAPGLPRYIDIPSLKVHARVLQVGLTASGAVGTPSNVFDTDWYTGSSRPGQPGAMLIDGHVSSWTYHGVFYGLKDLSTGDIIKVESGSGKTFTYKVVKSQRFNSKHVDMKSALTPVVSGKPGLNLITCTGDVIPGTNEFDQRIIVYTTQVSES